MPIGWGATLSAAANQQLLPNAHFDAVVKLSKEADAVGVNVAHSGTVMGMLFADDRRLTEKAADTASQRLRGLESVRCCRIVGGGVRFG